MEQDSVQSPAHLHQAAPNDFALAPSGFALGTSPPPRRGRVIVKARDLKLQSCWYLHDKLSDHKVFACYVQNTGHWQSAKQLKPTQMLGKPLDVADQDWRSRLEHEWSLVHIPDVSTTEQEWQEFHTQAEQAAIRALQFFTAYRPAPQGRAKGSAPQVTAFHRPTAASFKNQKLRNLLGRCLELQRQQGRPAYDKSLEQACRKAWVGFGPWSNNIDNNVAHLEAPLAEETKQQKAKSLQQWRQTMKAAGKGATAWLKPTLNLPAAVCYRGNEGELVYSHGGESHFDDLKRFWNPIWHRSVGQLGPEASQRLQLSAISAVHTATDDPFSSLTGEFLHKQATALKGSAGGVDGWSGTETADWPVKAWDIFMALVKRWVQRDQFPCCWRHLRQVHLPKPTATCHNGAYFASDLRPISVMSCSWRVLTSSMAKCPATTEWATQVLNSQCHGGRVAADFVVFFSQGLVEH
eukprot:s2085_g4.t1